MKLKAEGIEHRAKSLKHKTLGKKPKRIGL